MNRAQLVLACGVGAVLAASPFVRYGAGAPGAPHADHEPRHGGQLGMVGDHHLELVRGRDGIEVFVSDAWRRPLPARDGTLRFDGRDTRPLRWSGDRLVGPDVAGSRAVEAVVTLLDGTRLALTFDAAP